MSQATAPFQILPEIFLAFSRFRRTLPAYPRLEGPATLTTLLAMTGQTQTVTEHTRAAVGEVQRAWAELIASVPGARGLRRARALGEMLGLNPKLAWQVWRVVHAEDALEVIKHLPGGPGVRIALDAAAEQGASGRAVRAVERAMERFKAVVRTHAGDRATLGVMLGGQGDAGEQAAEEKRRALFQALSAVWGVRARTQLTLSVLHPGSEADVIDAASVKALMDLRRLRTDVSWILTRVGCHGEGTADVRRYREPIESYGPDGLGLIAKFCSRPMPKVKAIRVAPTEADLELQPGPVGETGAVTIVSGDVFRNLPRRASPQQPRGTLSPQVLTPCEVMIHDLLVHDGVSTGPPFTLSAYGDIRGEGFDELRERNRLTHRLSMEPLGRGMEVLMAPEVPRYGELVEHVHRALGWEARNFTAYRLRIQYPVTPSMVLVEFELES
jgi:hypothetical protein